MSQQVYKILRQFAKAKGYPYKGVKKVWENSSKEEQLKTLPSIKLAIEEAKKNDKKADTK